MQVLLTVTGYILTFCAAACALVALVCRARIYRPPGDPALIAARQPVTVLKPLCGNEPRLEQNLATLCEQTHNTYQLLLGVRDPLDPAIAAVERLKARYPERDIELVVDPRVHGTNLKVSNLINLEIRARYPWLVLADSDIGVGPDYLDRVTVPLADQKSALLPVCTVRKPWPVSGPESALYLSTRGSRLPYVSRALLGVIASVSGRRSQFAPTH